MSKMKILFIVAAMILSFFQIISAETEKDFHSRIESVYSFIPCSTSDDDKRRKYAEINLFWKYVEENADERIPHLRGELKTFKGNGLFLFDGASLLMNHSSETSDLNLVVSSFSRVDMCGIDNSSYFSRIHWMGLKGIDTFPAILRIIDSKDFEAFQPDHFKMIEKEYVVLYCSIVSDEKFWLDKMILKLSSEQNSSAATSLITAIAFSVTEKGQKAIEQYYKMTRDERVKKYARLFMKLENKSDLPKNENLLSSRDSLNIYLKHLVDSPDTKLSFDQETFQKEAPYLVTRNDYEKIKSARRKIASKVSNDSLDNILYLTVLMQFAFTGN
jgi:hypothetical protein